MAEKILADTGAIVALLIAGDKHHPWANAAWGQLEPPLYTCEAVLSESQFIVRRLGGDPLTVLEFVRRGALAVKFDVSAEVEQLVALQRSYRDVPMSFADACLVRMSELWEHSRVLTNDSDFRIYRRNHRQIIPLIAPSGI